MIAWKDFLSVHWVEALSNYENGHELKVQNEVRGAAIEDTIVDFQPPSWLPWQSCPTIFVLCDFEGY